MAWHEKSEPPALPAPEPEAWLQRVLKRKVIVHLVSDQSIEGVLMEHLPDGVILRAASLLGPHDTRTSMAGEVWTPRGQIAFMQLDE